MPTRTHTLAAALVATVPLALAACSAPEADPRTAPPAVRTGFATPAGASDRGFTGVVAARVESDLGFRVPGKIVERLVDTGQTVRRGQPLARIDRTDFNLAAAAQDEAVAAAQARATNTASDERRYRELVSAGAVSASYYEQAKAAADAARADLRAARARAEAASRNAGYSVLVADDDGVIVETLAEPGQVVAAGQTVLRLAHAGPREAKVSLPETLRPAIGSAATATLFGGTSVAPARLRELSQAADAQTRTFEARYVLAGSAASAPIGATVTVHVPDPNRRTGAMRLPLAAIYDGGRGPGVWVVGADSTVSWRPVRLGGLDDETAFVTGGIGAGERVVTLGAHLLHSGQKVRLSSTGAVAK